MKRKFLRALAVFAVLVFGTMCYIPETDKSIVVSAQTAGIPQGLGYSVLSTGKIRLIWDRTDNADGYVVYKLNKKSGKWVRLKSVKNNYLTISGIKTGVKYYYKVASLTLKDKTYYRGQFSDYVEVSLTVSKNTAQDLSSQKEFLATYYKTGIAPGYEKTGVTTKAFIAPADIKGGEIMLVNVYYDDDNVMTYIYGIQNGKIAGTSCIAESSDKSSNQAYFVRDEINGEYYIYTSNNFSSSYEFKINRVENGQMYSIYNVNMIGNMVCYINDEVADYGHYLGIQNRYIPCTEKNASSSESDESYEIYYFD